MSVYTKFEKSKLNYNKVISEKEFTKVLIPPLRGVRDVRINGTNSKTPP